MNYHQSFEKCSILTPDIRKQTQTSLEALLRADGVVVEGGGGSSEWKLEGATYVNMVKLGASQKF